MQGHLSQESAGRWLIFDNADDIDMWIKKDGNGDGSPALKEYLPRNSQGRIIFTTLGEVSVGRQEGERGRMGRSRRTAQPIFPRL
jgi:hypothetical protein